MQLQKGDRAPSFSASDHHGAIHTLAEYAGRFLLLYFYPKDDTPGCTKEACGFRDHYASLASHVAIVGVSKDDTDSHKRFVEKYTLPFPLLADTDCAMIRSYGADGVTYPKRVSFLIDAKGIIAKVYETVMCEEHAREVILDLQEMSGTV